MANGGGGEGGAKDDLVFVISGLFPFRDAPEENKRWDQNQISLGRSKGRGGGLLLS